MTPDEPVPEVTAEIRLDLGADQPSEPDDPEVDQDV